MQTKDLRYTPAEYTREHQRTYTVLDIAEGDSTTVVVSPAMQYSDALRAYDITTVESTLVTDTVSKWLLTGEAIWDTLEHLRLQIRTVDSQRIALPDGFVGRVLIARVTPDANAEAPELIRLGALLHRIQQEPTALRVWKDKVYPVRQCKWMPNMDLSILNHDLFAPIRHVLLPHDLEHHYEPIYDAEINTWKWTDEKLRMFWRDYERSQELQQELDTFMATFPYNAKVSDKYFVDLNPVDGLALQVRRGMIYNYPQDYWLDWREPSKGFKNNVQVKEVSLCDIQEVPSTGRELRAYMRNAVYLRVPLGTFRGQQYYAFMARGKSYPSYIGTHFVETIPITYNKDTNRDYQDIYHISTKDAIETTTERGDSRVLSNYMDTRVRSYRWAQTKQGVLYSSATPYHSRGLTGRISALGFASHNAVHTPQDAVDLLDVPYAPVPDMYENDPVSGHRILLHTRDYLAEGGDETDNGIYPRYGIADYVEVSYIYIPSYTTRISPSPDTVLATLGITADTSIYPLGERDSSARAVPWSSSGLASPNREHYRVTAFRPTDVWRISYYVVSSRNLWHLKGIYEKWQQLRKASEHSTSDSLSSS